MKFFIFIIISCFIVGKAYFQICGGRRYNPAFEQCCRGTIQSSFGNKKCCGWNLFDPWFEQCCGGAILKKDVIRNKCCGIKQFNPSFEICCFGRIYSKFDAKYC